MVEFWGALCSADTALLERTLDGLADGVYATDPRRTKPQRRADALQPTLAAGPHTMDCECGASDCPRPRPRKGQSGGYHILAEAAALSGGSDATGYLRVPASFRKTCYLRKLLKRAVADLWLTVIAAVRRVPLPPVGETGPTSSAPAT